MEFGVVVRTHRYSNLFSTSKETRSSNLVKPNKTRKRVSPHHLNLRVVKKMTTKTQQKYPERVSSLNQCQTHSHKEISKLFSSQKQVQSRIYSRQEYHSSVTHSQRKMIKKLQHGSKRQTSQSQIRKLSNPMMMLTELCKKTKLIMKRNQLLSQMVQVKNSKHKSKN